MFQSTLPLDKARVCSWKLQQIQEYTNFYSCSNFILNTFLKYFKNFRFTSDTFIKIFLVICVRRFTKYLIVNT